MIFSSVSISLRNFTSQKPIYKAYEQQSEEVKQWIEEDFPKIKKQAKKKMRLFTLETRQVCEVIIKLEKHFLRKAKRL